MKDEGRGGGWSGHAFIEHRCKLFHFGRRVLHRNGILAAQHAYENLKHHCSASSTLALSWLRCWATALWLKIQKINNVTALCSLHTSRAILSSPPTARALES